MERPLAVIGFSYLSALVVALFCGVNLSLWIAIICIVGFVVSIFIKPLRKEKIIPTVLITSVIAISMFCVYNYAYIKPTENIQDQTAEIKAVLCDIPYEQNGRYYYKLETKEISGKNQNITILVSSQQAYNIQLYDNITATIKFFKNNDVTSTNYNISKKIILRGSIDNYSEVTISENKDKPLYYYILMVRKSMIDTIQHTLPKEEAVFIMALLLGDKTGISNEEKEVFSSAGVSHIISVSGFHLAVITRLFMFIFCFVTKKERLSSILCTFIIFIFMAVVGFSPSVFRAGVMQIIFLVGKSILRQSDSLNSLGFSVLLICFINPYAVADTGLLLSFSATLGIILCHKKMTVYIFEHTKKMRYGIKSLHKKINSVFLPIYKSIISIISITVSATIFTLPITIFFFQQFALYSIITNLMISFAVSVLIFSAIIMVLLKISIWLSFLALPFTVISALLSKYVIWSAELVSSIPFSTVQVSKSFIPLWLGLTLLFLAFIFILKKRKQLLRYFAVISVVSFLVGTVSDNIFKNNSTKISILDVGQGLSIVLTSNNQTAVLSCGGESAYSSVLNNYLESSDIKNINYLLLSSNKEENSLYADKLLSNFSANNIQVYNEEKYYERTHRLILKSENVIISEENSNNTVHFNDIDIKTSYVNGNIAIYFIKNNISFLICNHNTDCSALPRKWTNPDFLIVDGTLKNYQYVSAKYIILSDNFTNFSNDITQLSEISNHIYGTGENGNIALWLYNDDTLSIRRENKWLS